MIQEAMAQLADQLTELEGLDAIYRRGTQQVSLQVRRGESLLRLGDRVGGTKTELWDSDWFIRPADLVLSGIAEMPANGDRIDVTEEDGVVRRYQVLPPGPSEPCFRVVDARSALQIHSKFLEDV